MTALSELAQAAFEALDRHDADAFSQLCDPEAEFVRFTRAPGSGSSIRDAYQLWRRHLHGPEAIAEWWREIFDAYPGMGFALRAVDELGQSAICETQVSFGGDRWWLTSFVLTVRSGRIIGFEVFHPEVERRIALDEDRTLFVGQFQVQGKAREVAPSRPCAWTYHRHAENEWSVRVYPDDATAREALRG